MANFLSLLIMPGNIKETDAKKISVNAFRDADDLFLTTDSILFHQLSAKNYNCIWQDNENVSKDGSLSVYCGENGIRYLNCETEHGKTGQYLEMIMTASGYIEKAIPILFYTFLSQRRHQSFTLYQKAMFIFGKKK